MECGYGQETEYTRTGNIPAPRCTARRNNSLSTFNRMFAVGFIALVTLVIALAFAWLFVRRILPFAGIELPLAFPQVERSGLCPSFPE